MAQPTIRFNSDELLQSAISVSASAEHTCSESLEEVSTQLHGLNRGMLIANIVFSGLWILGFGILIIIMWGRGLQFRGRGAVYTVTLLSVTSFGAYLIVQYAVNLRNNSVKINRIYKMIRLLGNIRSDISHLESGRFIFSENDLARSIPIPGNRLHTVRTLRREAQSMSVDLRNSLYWIGLITYILACISTAFYFPFLSGTWMERQFQVILYKWGMENAFLKFSIVFTLIGVAAQALIAGAIFDDSSREITPFLSFAFFISQPVYAIVGIFTKVCLYIGYFIYDNWIVVVCILGLGLLAAVFIWLVNRFA